MKKKALVAILLAALVALMTPMVAFADMHLHDGKDCTGHTDTPDVSSSVNEAVVVSGSSVDCHVGEVESTSENAINADGGAKVTADSAKSSSSLATIYVNGATVNVTNAVTNESGATGSFGIFAEGGAQVTAGSVNADGNAIYIASWPSKGSSYATVDVKGDVVSENSVGIYINGDSVNDTTVTVGGNVTANKTSISASNSKTTVLVDGKVITQSSDGMEAAIDAYLGATVIADSIESTTNGIKVHGDDALVVVENDVNAKDGIFVGNGGMKGGTATVFGTIIAENAGIKVVDTTKNDYTINVFKIEASDGKMFTDGSGNNSDEITSAISKSVNYIIKDSSTLGSFKLTAGDNGKVGSIEDLDGNEYQTATAADDYIVTVETVSGYKFKEFAGDCAGLLTKNEDGTYTLIVPVGGGVSLELIYEAIKKQESKSSSSEPSWSHVVGSPEAPISDGSWKTEDGAFIYTINGYTVTNAKVWIKYTAADGNTYTGCFYFGADGKMKTGWQTIEGKEYYFNETPGATQGMMLVNTTTPDGKTVGADGAKIG